MNVIDASSWIEFFSDGPSAVSLVGPISKTDELLVPAVTLFEVYRHILKNVGRADALRAAAAMRRGRVIDLDRSMALEAAELSVHHDIPLPDAAAYAVARSFDAIFWTMDRGLAGLDGVRVQGAALSVGRELR